MRIYKKCSFQEGKSFLECQCHTNTATTTASFTTISATNSITTGTTTVSLPSVHTVFAIESFDPTKFQWDLCLKRLDERSKFFKFRRKTQRSSTYYATWEQNLMTFFATSWLQKNQQSKPTINSSSTENRRKLHVSSTQAAKRQPVPEFLSTLQKLAINCNLQLSLKNCIVINEAARDILQINATR